MSVKPLLSPKQVARAIGVSESSLKRWCDRGLIPVVVTAGGHRRLPIGGVLTFIRDHKQPLVAPDLLGLPSISGRGPALLDRAVDDLERGLIAGDEETCRRVVFDLYLADYAVHEICDRVMAAAMHRIGDRWECGELPIYRERHACGMVQRMLSELRTALPAANAEGFVAIGGSPEGDPYPLASGMAEIVCRAAGWRADSLGANLPLETISRAIAEIRPRLCWLSVTYVPDLDRFVEHFHLFRASLRSDVLLVLGGRFLTGEVRERLGDERYFENLSDFQAFLKEVEAGP